MERSHMVSMIFCFLVLVMSAVSGTATAVEEPKEVEQWFQELRHAKQKVTKLHFYFHDLLHGDRPTAALVAQANMSKTSPTFFGVVNMMDDPLTLGIEISSKRVGYMKGLYGTASLEEVALIVVTTFVFTDGVYNGSTLAVMGHNPLQHTYRELAIVGGTGVFRLASGIVTFKTYFFDVPGGNATVEVNVVALHY